MFAIRLQNVLAVLYLNLPRGMWTCEGWRARRDSNPRPLVPKTSALSAELQSLSIDSRTMLRNSGDLFKSNDN